MTDFNSTVVASGSRVAAGPPQVGQPDLTAVDSNIRQITAVERSWRLPQLPDTVKLDLAALPGVTPDSLSALLNGLDADLSEQGRVEEDPTARLQFGFQTQPMQRTALEQFRNFAAGVLNEPPPEEPSVDAVKLFKQRAIRDGYLAAPPDGVVDNSWSPELDVMRRSMAYDDLDAQYRGNRPGALPTEGVIRTLSDWTSPIGLMAAASNLGVFWDFGQVSREFSSWGDKWRRVNEAQNPVDFGRALLDAVTGPIDDVIMPVINVALIAGGFAAGGPAGGTAAAGATAALTAARAGRAATMVARLYQGGSRSAALARNVFRPADLASLRAPGAISRRLMGVSRPGTVADTSMRFRAGSAMATWRNFTPVARTRQAVGLGMRVGFTTRAQDLLPNYQATSLASTIPGVADLSTSLEEFAVDDIRATPLELALAPYNIFNPGTFFRSAAPAGEGAALLSRAGSSLFRIGANPAGRTVAGGVVGGAAGSILSDSDNVDPFTGAVIGAAAAGILPVFASSTLASSNAARAVIAGSVAAGGTALIRDDVDPWAAAAAGVFGGATLLPAKSAFSFLPNPGKYVGWVTDKIGLLNYQAVSGDERIVGSFDRALRRSLQNDPDGLREYEQLIRDNDSVLAALAIRSGLLRADGTPDLDATQGALNQVVMAAAIDSIAAALSGRGNLSDAYDDIGLETFNSVRNRLINMLRPIDTDVADPARLADEVATRFSRVVADASSQRKEYDDFLSWAAGSPNRSDVDEFQWPLRNPEFEQLALDVVDDPALYDDFVDLRERARQWEAWDASQRQIDDYYQNPNKELRDKITKNAEDKLYEAEGYMMAVLGFSYDARRGHVRMPYKTPPARRERAYRDRTGRLIRAAGSEWEWWYKLPGSTRRRLAKFFAPQNSRSATIGIDEVTSSTKFETVDEWADEFLYWAEQHTKYSNNLRRIRRSAKDFDWESAARELDEYSDSYRSLDAEQEQWYPLTLGGEAARPQMRSSQSAQYYGDEFRPTLTVAELDSILARSRFVTGPIPSPFSPERTEQIVRIAEEFNGKVDEFTRTLFGFATMDADQANRLVAQLGSDSSAMLRDNPASLLEAYIVENDILSTLGSWNRFSGASTQIDEWSNLGYFRDVPLLTWEDVDGVAQGTRRKNATTSKFAEEANQATLQAAIESNDVPTIVSVLGSGLATGRVTPARLDTPTKQDFEQIADMVRTVLRLREKINDEQVIKMLRLADRAAQQQYEGRRLNELSQAELTRLFRSEHVLRSERTVQVRHTLDVDDPVETNIVDVEDLLDLRGESNKVRRQTVYRFGRLMRSLDVTVDDLVTALDNHIVALADDAERWGALGMRPVALADDRTVLSGKAALQQRLRELLRKRNYVAAELDVPAIAKRIGDAGGNPDEFLEQVRLMREDGYKMVFGVDFLSPNDLVGRTRMFDDLNVRHLNAVTMGNFFARRQPAVARANQERLERNAIAQKLNEFGVGEFTPEDNTVQWMLNDLRRILVDEKDKIANLMPDYDLQRPLQKVRTAAQSTFAPVQLADLAQQERIVMAKLRQWGWSDEEAAAMYAALPKMREAEFQDLGLYAFEARFRQRNELTQALKFIRGGVEDRGNLINRQNVSIAVGGGLGGLAADDEDTLLGVGAGAAAGFLGGAGLAQAANVGGRLDRAIVASQGRSIGLLGDKFVRLRDALRFGLSPIFDISRYTEGVVLSQTASPRVNAAGERIMLPLNMSPKAIRRRMVKEDNLTVEEARSRFSNLLAEFKNAASGDFDVDVLDSTGRWFQQIGIAGFNPTTWMTGAYAEFRRQGMRMDEAYAAAKNMYTYGVGGRSAAELSVNFVFFPFSFQKKAFTAVAKWLNDDLARSILITDALVGYEALNERYNLADYWSDYLPVLDQLQRLNMFAYGISPGRFGGINAQLFETVGRAAVQSGTAVAAADTPEDAILAVFTPVGTAIRNEEDSLELQKLMRQLTPVINDISWMSRNLEEYQRILVSPTHQGRYAQVEAGYNEWNQYRRDLGQWLDSQGFTWSDLWRKEYLADVNMQYRLRRADLERKYPEWAKSRRDSIAEAQALDMERLNARTQVAAGTPTDQERMFVEYENVVADVVGRLEYQGVFVGGDDGWLDAPAWATDYLKEVAVGMLEQNRRFESVWEKFYRREFGPLTAVV